MDIRPSRNKFCQRSAQQPPSEPLRTSWDGAYNKLEQLTDMASRPERTKKSPAAPERFHGSFTAVRLRCSLIHIYICQQSHHITATTRTRPRRAVPLVTAPCRSIPLVTTAADRFPWLRILKIGSLGYRLPLVTRIYKRQVYSAPTLGLGCRLVSNFPVSPWLPHSGCVRLPSFMTFRPWLSRSLRFYRPWLPLLTKGGKNVMIVITKGETS